MLGVSALVFAACVLLQVVLAFHPTAKVFESEHGRLSREVWGELMHAREASPLRHVRRWYHDNYRVYVRMAIGSLAVLGLSACALAVLAARGARASAAAPPPT
jgi:hypothetical protein